MIDIFGDSRVGLDELYLENLKTGKVYRFILQKVEKNKK